MSTPTTLNLRGTSFDVFQIGFTGPNLNNDGLGNLEVKNPANSAFVNVSGADPVAAQNFVTLAYFQANPPAGASRTIRFAIGTATASSVTNLPAGARVLSCQVEVVAAYTAGTIDVGQTGSTQKFQTNTVDNNPLAVGIYEVVQDTATNVTPAPVLATLTGAATGSGFVIVTFATPLP